MKISAQLLADSIRADNGIDGISKIYITNPISNTFIVSTPANGTLTVSEGYSNPKAAQISVSSSTTTGVKIFSFDLTARNQTLTIKSIPITFNTSDNSLYDVVASALLMKGSTVLASRSLSSLGLTKAGIINFTNLNEIIAKDSTATYSVVVDLKGDIAYADGTTLSAFSINSNAGWIVSDASGGKVTPIGNAYGNTMTLTAAGISVTPGVIPPPTVNVVNYPGGLDSATFVIPFRVTAGDTAVWIGGNATLQSTPSGSNRGVTYAMTTSSTATTTTHGTGAVAAVDGYGASSLDANNNYYVAPNTSRAFRFTQTVRATSSSVPGVRVGLMLSGINYSDTSTMGSIYYTSNLGAFRTSDVNLTFHGDSSTNVSSISVTPGTPSTSVTPGLSGQGDTGQFNFPFTVTAGDKDTYISAKQGWTITSSSMHSIMGIVTQNLSTLSTVSGDVPGSYYRVPANTSRAFTFTMSVTAIGNGYMGIMITNINYGLTSALGSTYTSNLGAFKTRDVYLNGVAPSVSIPNLIVGAISPTSVTTGTTTKLYVRISNIGTVNTGVGFANVLQRADNAAGTMNVQSVATWQRTIPLYASMVVLAPFTYTFPSADAGTTRYLRVCADSSNVITESNESDNCGPWTAVTVNSSPPPPPPPSTKPDITAGAISPTTAKAGTLTIFYSRISNIGTVSTGGGFTNTLQRANDAAGTGVPTVNLWQRTIPLYASMVALAPFTYTFPSADAGTTRYLRVCTDITNMIAESNEGNNCSPWTAVTVATAGTVLGNSTSQSGFQYVWNNNLQIGSPNVADVAALQTALMNEGLYSGEITGGFYSQTFASVKQFQEKYSIDSTGFVGPDTRAKLNELY